MHAVNCALSAAQPVAKIIHKIISFENRQNVFPKKFPFVFNFIYRSLLYSILQTVKFYRLFTLFQIDYLQSAKLYADGWF